MASQKSILGLLLVLWCSSAIVPGFAQGDNQPALPAGYYVYLGPEPGKAPPKGFTIKWDGSVLWQGDTGDPVFSTRENSSRADLGSSASHSTNPTPAATASPAAKLVPGPENCETYKYPVIRWRPRPIGSSPGAYAQLWTTYSWPGVGSTTGKIKYKLTLFKAPSTVQRLEVQLLDHNGFRLAQFDASDFYVMAGTDLMESRGDFSSSENDYKQIGDYSVK